MSSTDDLILLGKRGGDLYRAVPGFERGDFISVVTSLIWLDRQAGVDSPDNMIIVTEELSLFMPFWVTFTDPEINFLLCLPAYSGNESIDRAVQDRLHQLLMRPVEVVFVDPRGECTYPLINGHRRIIATTPSITGIGKGPHAYTAKPSGERVKIDP